MSRYRKKKLSVYVLEEELAMLEEKAHFAGMSKSMFIRNIILYGNAYEQTCVSREDAKELSAEIKKQGTNLNQIAVHVNTRSMVDERDFHALYDNYVTLLATLSDFTRGRACRNGDNKNRQNI